MLKQLMIDKKIEQRKAALAELEEQERGLQTRAEQVEAALTEAQMEEELAAVEEEVNKLEAEKAELTDKKTKLQAEIAELEKELEELNSKEPINTNTNKERNDKKMTEKRAKQEYFTREVEDFYNELRTRLQARANGQVLPPGEAGAELIIPDIVVNRIRERIGDYTTLYPLVDKITAGGRVKLILDVDTGEATWVEQRAAIPEEDDSHLTAVEFDGFKVGRIVYIDNSLLEDSIINLDDYLTKRIARSIAKALDKAILLVEGPANKQPVGIIPQIPAENQVSAPAQYEALIPLLGLIDTGEDATGEIVCVVHRQTYYSRLANLTLHVDAAGKDVVMLPNLQQPN